MRLVGAALIAAAFAALGVSESLRLRRRARLVSALCSGLELLRGEIVSRLAPMPEAAERLARYGPEPARGFYAAVCAGLENLGGSLGRYGAAEQAAAISACEQELRREAERAAQEAQVMGRLRAGLAAGAGLILAIVLY